MGIAPSGYLANGYADPVGALDGQDQDEEPEQQHDTFPEPAEVLKKRWQDRQLGIGLTKMEKEVGPQADKAKKSKKKHHHKQQDLERGTNTKTYPISMVPFPFIPFL